MPPSGLVTLNWPGIGVVVVFAGVVPILVVITGRGGWVFRHGLFGSSMQGRTLWRSDSPPFSEVNPVDDCRDPTDENDNDNAKNLIASDVFILKI